MIGIPKSGDWAGHSGVFPGNFAMEHLDTTGTAFKHEAVGFHCVAYQWRANHQCGVLVEARIAEPQLRLNIRVTAHSGAASHNIGVQLQPRSSQSVVNLTRCAMASG